jgi:uracil-DNA glycosylase
VSSKNGCLKNWAKQGVLLLNSSLTVEYLKPGSHSNIGWDKFIINIIKILNKKNKIVFILWGNQAIQYSKYIDQDDNLILSASHPSPLSAYRGFFGSKHFSKCNSYLKENNLKEINW